MNTSSYKNLTTSRGIKYHYFTWFDTTTLADKPTLLFLHGFPTTSYSWRHQVSFFRNEGYRLIVPDMLGYGGTDKPLDPAAYKGSLLTADLIEILDTENVEKAIAIGHDWGSVVTSRLASFYPERFLGFAFLASPYHPPTPEMNVMEVMQAEKEAAGYETLGYLLFFCEDAAERIIESHWDSFFSILYPDAPRRWKTDMAPRGSIKAWLLADNKGSLPSYVTLEEWQKTTEAVKIGGIAAPLNWYKLVGLGIMSEDDKTILKESYAVKQPVFFGGALQDCICLSRVGKAMVEAYCGNTMVKEFDAGHWVHLELPGEVNCALLEWISGIRC